jgi:hypothetical protein
MVWRDLTPDTSKGFKNLFENINDLKKEIGTPLTAIIKVKTSGGDSDEQGGRRTVKNKVNKRYVCPHYGKKGHHDIEGCKFKDKTCNICKKERTLDEDVSHRRR